mmetsp:Transcript_15275/g.50181  ORF Transcript_15275/g.50181 Transcript_15275/m.50181 type:complete len:552 (+) Transcript_15275:25-1680(+)
MSMKSAHVGSKRVPGARFKSRAWGARAYAANYEPLLSEARDDDRAWVRERVVYQIFPDRFARGPEPSVTGIELAPWGSPPTIRGFQGGDLDGVTSKLSYIEDLGINCIYLCPVFSSGSNHRYHPNSFVEVDPMLGGAEALKRLVSACHDRGVRIVLDGVYNHTGRSHHAFASLLENGAESPYRDWFSRPDGEPFEDEDFPLRAYPGRGEEPNYACWWDIPDLPRLNYKNAGVKAHVLEAAVGFVERFGADGLRLDYPLEIPWQVLSELRSRLGEVGAGAGGAPWIIGEVFGLKPAWCHPIGPVCGLQNYVSGSLALGLAGEPALEQDEAIGGDYSVSSLSVEQFALSLEEMICAYKSSMHLQMNVVGTHDTARVLTIANGDRVAVRFAFLILACIPGVPTIFQGDELGLQGGRDPEMRVAMPWGQEASWDGETRSAIKAAFETRRKIEALQRGGFRRIRVVGSVGSEELYAFARTISAGPSAVVVLNAGREEATKVSLTGVDLVPNTAPGTVFEAALGADPAATFAVDERGGLGDLSVSARSALILVQRQQ